MAEKTRKKARMEKARPETRQDSAIFGLGAKVTVEDAEITGIRLPTNEQVLRCFRFHQVEVLSSNCSKRDIAKIILEKLLPFYMKANIPMITAKKACEKIIELADRNAKLREIPVDRRSSPGVVAKLKEAEVELKKMFPMWPRDAEKTIKDPEDLAFWISMKTDRKASFGSHDKVLSDTISRTQARKKKEDERKQKAIKEQQATYSRAELSSSSDDTDEEGNPNAVEVGATSDRRHRRTVRPGTLTFVPYDVLRSPRLVSLATRIKMTPTQQASFTKALIEEGGGDPSKVVTSYCSADRARRSVGKGIATSAKRLWVPPIRASLHWDSKLMSSLENQNVVEERLSIAVGDSSEMKLLGTPAYLPGTDRSAGDIISEQTMALLNSWNCADNNCQHGI